MKRLAAGLLAASLMGVSGGLAEELKPMNAAPIALASLKGVAYYTAETDGFRVVATFADEKAGLPVRFVATLADGQSVRIAVPRGVNEPAHAVEIAREADKVFVRSSQEKIATAMN